MVCRNTTSNPASCNAFINGAFEKKAKLSGQAYIKTTYNFSNFNINGLPTAYELTHDPDWAEGGEKFELFNLHLDDRLYGVSPCGNHWVNRRLTHLTTANML